jgi:polysaccharide biosynthesis protein PslH
VNLLMVSPNLPRPMSGASTRNYHLLKTLARQHSVSLLARVDSTEAAAYSDTPLLEDFAENVQLVSLPASRSKRLRQFTSVVQGRSYSISVSRVEKVQKALDVLLSHDHYDVVLFESVLIAGYRLPQHVKVIIDQHNIEHELLYRTYQYERTWLRKWYNWWEYRLLKPVEIELCRKADLILVTSERELLLLQSMLPGSVIEVVPNGVDTETFHDICVEQEVAKQIIFTGAMDYYPNIDAVLSFAQRCWPLIRAQIPDATWQIVGRNPPPEVQRLVGLPGITVTGTVPDVRPYLAASTVAIAPLLIGGGTRLKILEALAMRKAVVSTTVGCEGLALVSGKHLIVADQPEAFAQAVVELVKNPEKRRALGTAGRSLVEAEYSWERCGDQLLHALEKVS